MVEHVIQIKSGITTNVNVYIYLSIYIYIYTWNSTTCNCENGKQNDKYLESIIGDSEITCDEIIRTKKTFTINLAKNKMTCKAKNFYILLTFSLISISLLIFGSIYWYLIIYRPKQEHRLPYYDTSNKLKEIGFHNIIQK